MADVRQSQFGRLRKEAGRFLDKYARSGTDGRLPVALGDVLAARKVRAIRFEPLWSDAGVEEDGDGFVICVNTEARGVREAPGTTVAVSEYDWTRLASPVRFSIAHELAHLIVLELAGGKAESDIFRRHAQALETTCNEMAGAILLPRAQLVREVDGRFFDTARLVPVCDAFGVSPEVLLLRLGLSDMREAVKDVDGILALVLRERDNVEVASSVKLGTLASQRWRHLADRSRSIGIEELYLPSELVTAVCEQNRVEDMARVMWREDMILPCEVTAYRIYDDPLKVLIGIRVAGPPAGARG